MEQDNFNENPLHPSHYQIGNIEPVEYIEDKGWGKGFNRGNAIKYISRAGEKDNEIEDLQKAIYYIELEIARIKKQSSITIEKTYDGELSHFQSSYTTTTLDRLEKTTYIG